MRRSQLTFGLAVTLTFLLAACADDRISPTSPGGVPAVSTASSWGPETPHFNLEVILRGEGFGHVKFRQPNDDDFIVYLDTWVRGLAPNTSYLLERAVDTTIDNNCTSTTWLTLGAGPAALAITTDERGTGRAELWRQVPPTAGAEFDIHFRVINELTSAVVLTSECYQYKVSL